MSKPRVIFVNRVYWPAEAATAQLLTDLAEELATRGWSVHVIAAGAEPGPRAGVTVHRTGEGDRHRGLWSRARNYRRFRAAAERQLEQMAGPGDVVVLMTDPPLLARAAAGAIRRGARVVHWIQDIYPEILSAHLGRWSDPLWCRLRAQRDAAWRVAQRCVVLGADMAETVAGRGVDRARIAIVPNWAPRELGPAPAAGAARQQREDWGVADRFVVTYSGNLGRVHEFAAILDAAEQLRSAPVFQFLFIGHGARFAAVRAAAQRRGLPNVRFLPPTPRSGLAASLAAAEVHLVTLKPAFLPLVYPSKLAGVLAAGRPVAWVGPVAGEIGRVLGREGCGAAFAPDEGARLAAELRRWQSAPDECARMGLRSRQLYERAFTFNAAVGQWEAILAAAGAGSP